MKVPVAIRSRELASLDASHLYFEHSILLEDVQIGGHAGFQASYFFAGFAAIRSAFLGPVDFLAGGHNKGAHSFKLHDCAFAKWVEFGDCWFEGPVFVAGCRFDAGTDLFGNVNGVLEVRFDTLPQIDRNVGLLDLDIECAPVAH